MKLKIAEDLSLPVDVVTQTIAVLAKRRAGKSYTMRRLVEQLHAAGQQIVLVDPKGDQWGVRSAADGKAPGLPIVILGGERADVPLEAGAGEVVAKLVVEDRVSALLDLSLFRKHEVATFMTGFLESLYRLKAREIYRTPLMLVIDEADAIAPQKPQKGEERMLGAAEDIVRRGGQRGIGCVLVTQRSAVLNKNVLTQAQVLIAMRTIAPQDLAAMNAWIDVHGTEDQKRMLMASLPSLPVGDAWVWSPGWPTIDGIFRRVHVLPIETFDSGATPKPGEQRREPKTVADVDLEALKRQMSATIEKAKADDPRELRKQIADLKKQLASNRPLPADNKPLPAARVVEKFVLKDGQLARAEALVEKTHRIFVDVLDRLDAFAHAKSGVLTSSLTALGESTEEIAAAIAQTRAPHPNTHATMTQRVERPQPRPSPHERRADAPPSVRRPAPVVSPSSSADGSLSIGERKILTAVAQYPDDGASREQLTILTGYKRSSRDAYLQRLSTRGYVSQNGNGSIHATQAGVDALGADFEPLPVGEALLAWWRNRLPVGERAVLEAAVQVFPDAVERDAISEETGYKRSSRDAYVQRLLARRLVTTDRGTVRAADALFD